MNPGSGVVPLMFLGTFPGGIPCRAIVMRPMSGVTAPRVRSMAGPAFSEGQTSAQIESQKKGVVDGLSTAESFLKKYPLVSGRPV